MGLVRDFRRRRRCWGGRGRGSGVRCRRSRLFSSLLRRGLLGGLLGGFLRRLLGGFLRRLLGRFLGGLFRSLLRRFLRGFLLRGHSLFLGFFAFRFLRLLGFSHR